MRPMPRDVAGAVLAAGWRGWGWRETGLGVLLGVLCLVYMGAPLQPGAFSRNWAPPLAYNILQFGLPLVFALRVADAAVDRGAGPRWPYALAVLSVVAGGVWVIGPLLMPVLGSDPFWTIAHDVWLAVGIGVVYALGVAVYANARAAGRALARAHAVETAAARRARELQAARLLALQARVEPALLFSALQRVQQDTARDPAAADRRLEDLIALLRRLQGAGATSTLAQERALADLAARVAGEPAPRWAVPPALEARPLAPMVLRQLAQAAPGGCFEATARRGGWRLSLRPAGPLEPAALDTLRTRLQGVHGPDAAVTQEPGALHLDLPEDR